MSLQELQQRVLQAVLAERSPFLRELRDDERADAASRLAIYRNGYRVRLRDALAIEFPGLGKLLGGRFARMLERYVDAHPSEHYNIRWHGAGIAAFLRYALPWREKPALAELAELDWAISTCFDAADEAEFDAAELASVPADAWPALRLRLQNHLQLVPTCHNIEAFRRAADGSSHRPRLRRYEQTRQLLVWRQSLTVHYRVLAADEFSALTGAIKGESFAALCERLAAFHDDAEAMPRMVGLLRQWLADGLVGGRFAD